VTWISQRVQVLGDGLAQVRANDGWRDPNQLAQGCLRPVGLVSPVPPPPMRSNFSALHLSSAMEWGCADLADTGKKDIEQLNAYE
jgi:hypothetical protein